MGDRVLMTTRSKDLALLTDEPGHVSPIGKSPFAWESVVTGPGPYAEIVRPCGFPTADPIVVVTKSDGSTYYVDSDSISDASMGRLTTSGNDYERLVAVDKYHGPTTTIRDEYGRSNKLKIVAPPDLSAVDVYRNYRATQSQPYTLHGATPIDKWRIAKRGKRPTILVPQEVLQSAWFSAAIARIAELFELGENWDGYQGRPIAVEHALNAVGFLLRVMSPDTPAPAIVPLSDGGVQLEWHQGGLDIEATFTSDDDRGLYWEELNSGSEFEGSLEGSTDDLRRLLAQVV